MATSDFVHPPLVQGPGDRVVERVLREIRVPADHLAEAKRRRDLVCSIARGHDAARDHWHSGSIAHGTENDPLGDADCGVMVDRRSEEYRSFGPDALNGGRGPEAFVQSFAAWILPLLQANGYPNAQVDLTGNRAIKFDFGKRVAFGIFGEIDPTVDLIVGLQRRDGPGVWIPNRRANDWEAANPEEHTRLMKTKGGREVAIHRARLVRLQKRAVKRDGVARGFPVVCSWNLGALALENVSERLPLARALAAATSDAAMSLERELTDDPAHVAGPIALPKGSTQQAAAGFLSELAGRFDAAARAQSEMAATQLLRPVFAVEFDRYEKRQREELAKDKIAAAVRRGDRVALGSVLVGAGGSPKIGASHGQTSA